MKYDYDVAILGGGSAGYAAARTTAAAGLKTVVIEGGAEVGGLCILRGCMPSKALLYAAEVLHQARHADTWGIKIKSAGFDFKQVMRRKAERVKEFADYRRQQLENGKFQFIRANAKFLDAHKLELAAFDTLAGLETARERLGLRLPPAALETSGAGGKAPEGWRNPEPSGNIVTAKHFVIATGSIVATSPLPALNDVGYITSDEALSLKRPPKSLIVLGGGAIACELAQFFVRFDVKVTLIQRSPRILKEFDDDASAVVETVFRREGIKLFTDTKLLGARRDRNRKVIEFEHEGRRRRVQADEVLFALGRTANTAGLGLENAGVKTENSRITVNMQMRTSLPHIFAAGDCTGPHDIVHIAVQQAEIAAHNILHPRRPRRADYRLFTSIVFTDPQVATVGLTEKEAKARKIPFLAASYPFNDHGKSIIAQALDGFVKLLADPKTGEILGGCCVGPVGGELIHEINVAMAKRMTVHELAATPHYHPTLAEIWTYPAEELAQKIPGRPK
jgi:pyruvate/2-oxoglutarate dehydrogenase complex dihydrolipoamide dehydrogenase (E3) component